MKFLHIPRKIMNNKNKIALIKCSGSLNVGNEFINAGAKYVIEKLFPDCEILEYEFFDSAIKCNWTHPSPALLDWTKKEIENECKMMFVASGCIISKFTETVLNELSKIKVKKILLGAGSYQYNDFDKNLSRKLIKMFDYIITRDDISYSYFNNAKNVLSGIDMAFFITDILKNPQYIGDYMLLNIDNAEDNLDLIKKYKKIFKRKAKNVYVIENTTKPHNIEDFLYIGYWDNLYKTISHAKFVVTNRIHTAVCCITNQVPFLYLGNDDNRTTGRSSLFSKFDFKLLRDNEYTKDDLLYYKDKIKTVKEEFFNNLKEFIFKEEII